jgi:hypothetical protein
MNTSRLRQMDELEGVDQMDVDSTEDWTRGISQDEIRAVWTGQLQPVPAGVVAQQAPQAVREFLTRVGLPDGDDLDGITFAHDARLSQVVRCRGRDYLLLTRPDSTATFGVNVATGQVFAINEDPPDEICFFNSDIAALVYFLGLLKVQVLDLEEATEETLPPAVSRVWEELRARDPDAAREERSWKAWLDDLESQAE